MTGGKCEGTVTRQIRLAAGHLVLFEVDRAGGATAVRTVETSMPQSESVFKCGYKQCIFFRGARVPLENGNDFELDLREKAIMRDNCGKRHLKQQRRA